jgi:hypothetical protein
LPYIVWVMTGLVIKVTCKKRTSITKYQFIDLIIR